MKANEIQIRDWVLTLESTHKEKVYAQIWAIEEDQTTILVKKDNCNWFVDIEWIEPIPLTAEILEKNGWKYEFDKEEYRVKYMLGEQGKNCWMMWSCKYHIIDIQRQDEKLDMYNLCITKVCVPCEYVHQLQQALRLSELTDLADNFKV